MALTPLHRRYRWLQGLVLALACLPLLIGGGILQYLEATWEEKTGEALANTAGLVANDLDVLFVERSGDLRIFSQAEALHGDDRTRIAGYLKNILASYPVYSWAGWLNRNDELAVSTAPLSSDLRLSIQADEAAIHRGARLVLRQVAPTADGRVEDAGITFLGRVEDDRGRFRGTLVTRIGLSNIESTFQEDVAHFEREWSNGSPTEVQIFDPSGIAVVDSRLNEQGALRLQDLEVMSGTLAQSDEAGFVRERHARRHVEVLTGYAKTKGMANGDGKGWTVLLRVDRGAVLWPIRWRVAKAGLVVLVVFAPLLLGLLFGMRHLRRAWAESVQECERAQQAEEQLRREHEHVMLMAKVYQNSGEAVLISDHDNRILSVNRAFTTLTGYEEAEVLGRDPKFLSAGLEPSEFYRGMWTSLMETGSWSGELRDRRKDGHIYPKRLSINVVKGEDRQITHFIGIFHDVTERRMAQQRVEFLATHDALTGLPNRNLLLDHLRTAVAQAKRQDTMAAVVFLDLDHFKWVNDSLGHAMGDKLLKTVAERLTASVRASDTVARLGGDEFVIVAPAIHSMTDMATFAEKIVRIVEEPVLLGHREFRMSTSLGISVYPTDGDNGEQLIQHADTAMYAAKSSGRNQWKFFDRAMNAETVRHAELAQDLRFAVKRAELELFYQPKRCLAAEGAISAEVLLRWRHPVRGLLSPADFISIAEDTGLIIPVGDWVIRTACEQLVRWSRAGLGGRALAVNVSPVQLQQGGFVERVRTILEETGAEPSGLELELTESVMLKNRNETIEALYALRAMGVRLALDDFGTGYSSLSYLRQLPIHTIKVDRAFVKGLPDNQEDCRVIKMIVGLAQSSGLTLVAEGVETQEQSDFLQALGCDLLQGYRFGRPMSLDDYEASLLGAAKIFGPSA